MGLKRERGDKKGRAPCCDKEGVRRGTWSAEEDQILVDYITEHGIGNWRNVPELAGLVRCGKSCRLRWINYLRPDIKRGPFSPDEENTIIHLHSTLGNKWAAIAANLPGRTDNDVKNFWNSHLRKRYKTALDQPCCSNSIDTRSDTPVSSYMAPLPTYDLSTPQSSQQESGDYFIRLWNSEVGESFRDMSKIQLNNAPSHSTTPSSQTSSLTKVDSADRKVEIFSCKKEVEDVEAYLDLSHTLVLDDSSPEAMMKLLLDHPVGGNDMGFFEDPVDFSTYFKG